MYTEELSNYRMVLPRILPQHILSGYVSACRPAAVCHPISALSLSMTPLFDFLGVRVFS